MTYRLYFRLAVLLIMAALAMVAVQAASPLTLTVVYDNYPHQPGLTTDWGFACLVEGLDQTILFDTGTQGDVLLHNLDQLDLDPARVQQVVLSHAHLDHTGGLAAFLTRQPKVRVAVPVSFPDSIRSIIRSAGAKILPVQGPAPSARERSPPAK